MITSQSQNTHFGTILSFLNDVYATQEGILLADGTWEDLTESHPLQSLDSAQLLEQCQEYQPQVYEQGNHKYLCLPRLDFSDESFAVVDLSPYDVEDQNRISKIAKELHSSASSSMVSESVYRELSHLMEESSWLRNVSSFISICNADTEVEEISKQMLPRLKEIIKAKSIGFLPSTGQDVLDSHWFGNNDDLQASRILSHHTDWTGDQPLVANYVDDGSLPHSYIAVRVFSGGVQFGNLFAIQKIGQSLENKFETNITGEKEFGTNEAGLLEAVASLIGTQAHNNRLFKDKKQLFYGTIQAMTRAVDARDPYTRGHSDRVARYSQLVAAALGLDSDACDKIFLTGQLHDIGKIGIPDAILNKTGKLTDSEYEVIKQHPTIGYRILKDIQEFDYVLSGVLHHHERADGRGYPHGITGDQMSIDAQIISIADAFDAMTSTRSYRPGMPLEEAKHLIELSAGKQFTHTAIDGFLKAWNQIEGHALIDVSRIKKHPQSKECMPAEVV